MHALLTDMTLPTIRLKPVRTKGSEACEVVEGIDGLVVGISVVTVRGIRHDCNWF